MAAEEQAPHSRCELHTIGAAALPLLCMAAAAVTPRAGGQQCRSDRFESTAGIYNDRGYTWECVSSRHGLWWCREDRQIRRQSGSQTRRTPVCQRLTCSCPATQLRRNVFQSFTPCDPSHPSLIVANQEAMEASVHLIIWGCMTHPPRHILFQLLDCDDDINQHQIYTYAARRRDRLSCANLPS